jgi:hypothetical protein
MPLSRKITAMMMLNATQNQTNIPMIDPSRERLCRSVVGMGPKLGPISKSKRAVTMPSRRQTLFLSNTIALFILCLQK